MQEAEQELKIIAKIHILKRSINILNKISIIVLVTLLLSFFGIYITAAYRQVQLYKTFHLIFVLVAIPGMLSILWTFLRLGILIQSKISDGSGKAITQIRTVSIWLIIGLVVLVEVTKMALGVK